MKCRNYVKYIKPGTNEEYKDIVWFNCIPYGKDTSEKVLNLKFNNYVDKKAAIATSLTEKLSVLRGELWTNLAFGLPILDKYNSRGAMDAEVINIILSNSDIIRILEFKSNLDKHTYSCNVKILSKYGDLTIYL